MDNYTKKSKILIVDDLPENIRMLIETLKNDYATIPATSGEAALEKCQADPLPDLILLDILMPGMDGYEVCRRLKKNEKTKDIPVIFITGVSESLDDAKAFSLGAADYISKPFNVAIVKARVKNQIELRNAIFELHRLNSIAMDANPVTGLPGNNSIRKVIQKSLEEQSRKGFVIYADLDNFKAYNDKYGFAKGDEVIHFTASLLLKSLSFVKSGGFLGHVGGDDFVMLLPRDDVDAVVAFILEQFDMGILNFYDAEDVKECSIISTNREGAVCRFPLMGISLGGVNLAAGNYSHYLQINDACAEVKKRAKEIPGSSFFVDRRR